MRDHGKESDRRDDGRRERQDNGSEQPHFPDSVHGRRLLYLRRNTEEKLLEDEDIPSAYDIGQNERPKIIQKVELLNDEIIGNESARKEYCKEQEIDILIFPREFSP